jgi:hypothetical protein
VPPGQENLQSVVLDVTVGGCPGGPAFSGTVDIHSPDVDLAGALVPLPESFLDASSLMRERCAARGDGGAAGSFVVRDRTGIAPGPDQLLAAPPGNRSDDGGTAAAPGPLRADVLAVAAPCL